MLGESDLTMLGGEEEGKFFGSANVEHVTYENLASRFARKREVFPVLIVIVFALFAIEAIAGAWQSLGRKDREEGRPSPLPSPGVPGEGGKRSGGRGASMNTLLRLLGLDSGTDVGAVEQYAWRITRPLAPGWLYALVALALVLACVNFLPRIRMRRTVRVGTFLLRLGMAGLLLVILMQIELHLDLKVRQKQTWTVLVDDSASMATADEQGRSRFVAALGDVEAIRQVVGESVTLEIKGLGTAPVGDQPGKGPTLIQKAVEQNVLAATAPDRLLLLTDGRDTEGRDFTHLGSDIAARGIGLAVKTYGSQVAPSDAGIFAQPEQSILRLGEELIIHGSLTGVDRQKTCTVNLKENGKLIKQITVPPDQHTQFLVTHKPAKDGAINYTLELPESDALSLNNAYTFKVQVVKEKIRVFLIEGYPRFEFKLMKAALEVDPMIQLTSLVHIPGGGVYVQGQPLHQNPEEGLISSQAELFKYDVVILRDLSRQYFRAGGDATESRLRNLVEFVTKRGGGLMVLGGQDVFRAGGYEDSALTEVLPFDLSDYFSKDPQFEGMFFANVPKTAYGHPILRLLPDPARNRERLNALRELDGSNNVGRFKPLATPLLSRFVKIKDARGELVEKEVPILAYQPVGDGKVAAGAVDTLWRWQLQPEFDDPPLQTLLANIVRFIAPPPRTKAGAPDVRLPDGSPQVGQELLLSTVLKDKNFDPIRNADLKITVVGPDAHEQHLYPRDLPEQPGYYEYRVPLDLPGNYTVTAEYAREKSETSFVVEGSGSEYADLSPNRPAMQQLAKAADGQVISSVQEWLKDLDARAATQRAVRDLQVWNSPMLVILFVLLVCADCYLRKRQGLV